MHPTYSARFLPPLHQDIICPPPKNGKIERFGITIPLFRFSH